MAEPSPVFGHRLLAMAQGRDVPPALRRGATLAALALLALGTWAALTRTPLDPAQMRLAPLLWLVALALPATITLNATEMELSARLIGARFGVGRALRLTIFASAANMLPLPGAAMVRLAGLSAAGGSLKSGGAVTLMIALMWLGVAFAASGLFLLAPAPGFGAPALALGLGLTALALVWARRVSGGWAGGLGIAAVKLALVAVSVLRIKLCLAALGVPASLPQVSVFAVAGVLGSAISVVPAGLGVREAVSAALAPIVRLPAGAAFLATALDRLLGMAVMLMLAGLLVLREALPSRGAVR
ncbi:hypothetical protein [Acidimangrovimonas pyrenivorans]|uniref:Lysylphosphatidylglycerol synthetase family protein n=1 Tax=Acidimangrovimonas pyrenivorans TaxID=2030798 RepID=A0ABV7AC41_9RHOB